MTYSTFTVIIINNNSEIVNNGGEKETMSNNEQDKRNLFQQERMDSIMNILTENSYVTVEFLANELKCSPSSIRRDLTLLQKQGRVKRSYGGVEITRTGANTPFRFRQHKLNKEKSAIAKAAAQLVNDGDTIFLDHSSTVQHMANFLVKKKDLRVITSNLTLAMYLNEHGITVYTVCGRIVESPGVVVGHRLDCSLRLFNIDKAFFSVRGLSNDGYCVHNYELTATTAIQITQNSKTSVLLCTADKFNADKPYKSVSLEDIDYCITDMPIESRIKHMFNRTEFIEAKKVIND